MQCGTFFVKDTPVIVLLFLTRLLSVSAGWPRPPNLIFKLAVTQYQHLELLRINWECI